MNILKTLTFMLFQTLCDTQLFFNHYTGFPFLVALYVLYDKCKLSFQAKDKKAS